MKWIKSQRIFESEQVYLPTHEELENLPVFKEMKRVFHDWDVKWTTGARAYANGTRALRIGERMNWAFYPYKKTIVRIEGGGTKASGLNYISLESWEDALVKVFATALGEHVWRLEKIPDFRFDPSVLAKILKTRKTENLNKFIATYPGTPPEVLMTMFKKDDPVIDDRLARNPSSPSSLVEGLFKRAGGRANLTDSFSHSYGAAIISSLAMNSGLSEDLYRTLFRITDDSDNERALHSLLNNPSIPVDIRDDLMTRKVPSGYWGQQMIETRREIASTAKLSPDTLVELAYDKKDPELAAAAKKNPDFPDTTEWSFGDW